jgi:hypothetical protein
MTPRERTLLFATILAAGLGAVLWSYVKLADARAAARDSAEALADCSRLASRLQSQRGAVSPLPSSREPEAQELVKRIEAGAKIAGFTDASIDRIEPGDAEPVENAPYDQVPTTVQLHGVSLQQVLTFLHAVGTGKSGLQLKHIHLSTPQADDAGDRWSVETTLTCLVKRSSQEGAAE